MVGHKLSLSRSCQEGLRIWVVEKTFGWFNWCRRLSKDYEVLPATSETMIRVAMIRLMLKRLA
jgi:transposase